MVFTSTGDIDIIITITDKANPAVTSVHIIPFYVGSCYETCGTTGNFNLDPNSLFIGDAAGNPIGSDNCSTNTEKFLYVSVLSNANAYSLNITLNYTTTINGVTTEHEIRNSCFYEKVKIPTGKIRLHKINKNGTAEDIKWECGEVLNIENANFRWGFRAMDKGIILPAVVPIRQGTCVIPWTIRPR